jgi:predicted GH43/DUF377 family glycosyl hydrolase
MKGKCTAVIAVTAIMVLFPILCRGGDDHDARNRGPITVSFLPYAHNPVLDKGTSGAWDDAIVFVSHVVYKDGLFHLFYNGKRSNTPVGIGYATSPDGFNFTKSDMNPILTGSGSGFDAFQVSGPVPLIVGDTWVLYYSGRPSPGAGPGQAIGRATALSPTGPWSRDANPVLTVGSPGEWDSGWIAPNVIVTTDDGYVLYYTAGMQFGVPPQLIGMATSKDGITWTKYHDPRFTAHPYAESTPVLLPGPADSWDSRSVAFNWARKTGRLWEMFYSGVSDVPLANGLLSHQLGYAISLDGIHWVKYWKNPIMTLAMDPLAASTGYMEVPSVIQRGSVYFMYYDYGQVRGAFGVALGTITRCPEFCEDERWQCD